MRQAVMTSPGVIEHAEVPEPTPGSGEVLLRIHRIGTAYNRRKLLEVRLLLWILQHTRLRLDHKMQSWHKTHVPE